MRSLLHGMNQHAVRTPHERMAAGLRSARSSTSRKIRKRLDSYNGGRRVRIEKTHRVQVSFRLTKCIDWQSERDPSSMPVLASAQEADHGAVSETQTAAGMSDDQSSPRFRVADAEYLGGSLAPAV